MKQQTTGAGSSIVTWDAVLATLLAALLLFCLAGAVWTAYWSLRFGLAPRPPLSAWQTSVRFVAVIVALFLLLRRRDLIDRAALLCAVIAAGSSALYGLGFNSVTLQVVRLLFHFLAYSLGALAIIRWFLARRAYRQASLKAAVL